MFYFAKVNLFTIVTGFVLFVASQLHAEVDRSAGAAVGNLDVADGLTATLFASEPLISNPANLDVDHRGRVWVVDVANYRGHEGSRPEGDRVLILEDSDGDGVADKSTVFYQGKDIDAAMGIALVGSKVIVTCTPNIIVFEDTDGDDKADTKEFLFTKTGQRQHDHSLHSVVVGPDGRLYWNFGNTVDAVHDAEGKPVVDLAGNKITNKGKPYVQGMAFRCELDGSSMETVGHNFRNPYEVSVDSFADMWQSDNDDDGNKGIRINYIMDFGNYGYTSEVTGAGWRESRTGMAEDVSTRHWHQNDPGSIPNFIQTGSGSPTGITVYEGRLLPKVFWDQVIHCDAGPKVVRAYPARRVGAGYKSDEMIPILDGDRDGWFRPVDVCAATDGSLFISDWYDPTVGGHRQGDIERGRIYRVAPTGMKYQPPTLHFDTVDGAIEALKSPTVAVRFMARQALIGMGVDAADALVAMTQDQNPRFRARALWVLAAQKGGVDRAIELALEDPNDRVRGLAIKIARRYRMDVIPLIEKLASDPAPAVRRECAIALHGNKSPKAPELWAKLALQYDGQDRWYIEALGIGAAGQWDAFMDAWIVRIGAAKDSELARDIIWRSRGKQSLVELKAAILDSKTQESSRLRYIRALDFQPDGPEKNAVLLAMLGSDDLTTAVGGAERLNKYKFKDGSEAKKDLDILVAKVVGTPRLLELAEAFKIKNQNEAIFETTLSYPLSNRTARAIHHIMQTGGKAILKDNIASKDRERAIATIKAISMTSNQDALRLLAEAMENDKFDFDFRVSCLHALASRRDGAKVLRAHIKRGQMSEPLKPIAGEAFSTMPWPLVRIDGLELLGMGDKANTGALPPIEKLVSMKGNPKIGLEIYSKAGCGGCHRLNGEFFDYGPDLSEIGSKLPRAGMFEAIISPSAAISHGFEGVIVSLKNGMQLMGFISSETDSSLTLKMAGGISQTVEKSEVKERVHMEQSLMPEGLATIITLDELVSLVDYLETLKAK